jgi:hypothetical protein
MIRNCVKHVSDVTLLVKSLCLPWLKTFYFFILLFLLTGYVERVLLLSFSYMQATILKNFVCFVLRVIDFINMCVCVCVCVCVFVSVRVKFLFTPQILFTFFKAHFFYSSEYSFHPLAFQD